MLADIEGGNFCHLESETCCTIRNKSLDRFEMLGIGREKLHCLGKNWNIRISCLEEGSVKEVMFDFGDIRNRLICIVLRRELVGQDVQ